MLYSFYVSIGNTDEIKYGICRDEADNGKSTVQFKSEKRQELKHFHYRVAANVGDQWSDLTGEEAGIRTFKVPNPVYYVL